MVTRLLRTCLGSSGAALWGRPAQLSVRSQLPAERFRLTSAFPPGASVSVGETGGREASARPSPRPPPSGAENRPQEGGIAPEGSVGSSLSKKLLSALDGGVGMRGAVCGSGAQGCGG